MRGQHCAAQDGVDARRITLALRFEPLQHIGIDAGGHLPLDGCGRSGRGLRAATGLRETDAVLAPMGEVFGLIRFEADCRHDNGVVTLLQICEAARFLGAGTAPDGPIAIALLDEAGAVDALDVLVVAAKQGVAADDGDVL